MAKKRRYRTEADKPWSMEDDKRQAQYREDRKRQLEEEQRQYDAKPIYSICKPQGFSLWFWAVWKKGADSGGIDSIPWQHGTAYSRESAIAAAREVR